MQQQRRGLAVASWGLLLAVSTAAAAAAAQLTEPLPSVDGMQHLQLLPDSPEQLELLQAMRNGSAPLDFLTPTELLVPERQLAALKRTLRAARVAYRVLHPDVGRLVDEERAAQAAHSHSHSAASEAPLRDLPAGLFRRFPRYPQMVEWLRRLERRAAGAMRLLSIGRSSEGRELLAAHFSGNGGNGSNGSRPALLIDAGIHAREWISATTALYLVHRLANPQSDPQLQRLLARVDVYVVPHLNPDGYEFSHLTRDTRLWRKTRSSHDPAGRCRGVDANRNFDFHWMESGTSRDPCSIIYGGPSAFSEPETRALRDLVWPRRGSIKAYLSLHSYGNYLLHPWGYSSSDVPANQPLLRCAALEAARALSAVRGTSYRVGSSSGLMYPAAGGSDDWMMGAAGAELAYTMELPGGSFAPPASQILPVGQETFEAVKAFMRYVAGDICPHQK